MIVKQKDGTQIRAYRVDSVGVQAMKADYESGALPRRFYWSTCYNSQRNGLPEIVSVEVVSNLERLSTITVAHGNWIVITPIWEAFQLTNDSFWSLFVHDTEKEKKYNG